MFVYEERRNRDAIFLLNIIHVLTHMSFKRIFQDLLTYKEKEGRSKRIEWNNLITQIS